MTLAGGGSHAALRENATEPEGPRRIASGPVIMIMACSTAHRPVLPFPVVDFEESAVFLIP
jgi:hypothetical protein